MKISINKSSPGVNLVLLCNQYERRILIREEVDTYICGKGGAYIKKRVDN